MALQKTITIGESRLTADYLRSVHFRAEWQDQPPAEEGDSWSLGGKCYVRLPVYESAERRAAGDGPVDPDGVGVTVRFEGLPKDAQDLVIQAAYAVAKHAEALADATDVLEEGQTA